MTCRGSFFLFYAVGNLVLSPLSTHSVLPLKIELCREQEAKNMKLEVTLQIES